MDLEKRVLELEKIVNALVSKDREIDRFCEEILDSVKEIGYVLNSSNVAHVSLMNVVEGIVAEIKKIQSK